jgi:sugar lactone lactonase YvrE
MKALRVFTIVLLAASAAWAQESGPIQRLERLVEAQPGHTGAIWYLALLHTKAGNVPEALRWLDRLVKIGVGADPASDRDFKALAGAPGFDALSAEARRRQKRVSNSREAFRVGERDLVPEGIAYDPVTDTFFVGSTHKAKIVAVDRSGRARDFVAAGRDGLGDVLGMKVDARRRTLWAASARGGKSALYAFDLPSGKLLGRYPVDGDGHQLNDLVVHPRGAVYVTDSQAGAVYVLAPSTARLEPYLAPGQLIAPNGIAISDDGLDLFVANFGGVRRVTLADKTAVDLEFASGVISSGIDGLYWYKGDLVGIENVTSPGRVVRYELDGGRRRVERVKVLEAFHPEFAIPTTGTLARGRFYYLANSFVDLLGDDGKVTEPERL